MIVKKAIFRYVSSDYPIRKAQNSVLILPLRQL